MRNQLFTDRGGRRYSACMRTPLIIPLILLLPVLAMAEPAVMPPPSDAAGIDRSSDRATVAADEPRERSPNLRDELKAPGADSNVDVRSYKRKDGATVTEYAVHGEVYEIKVQPAGGMPAYYLYRNRSGHFERRRPGGKPMITPPSWVLKKF